MYLGEELAYDIFVRECLYFLRDVVRIYVLFFSLSFSYIILLYTSLVTIYL